MKITILANRDLHSNIAINLLRPHLDTHQVALFLSKKVGRPREGYSPPEELLQLKFLEQDLFLDAITPLAELRPRVEPDLLTFRQLGEHFGAETQLLQNVNGKKGLARFVATEPDLVLSLRYGCILRERAIAVPRLGVLNLHSGLLPRYQGVLTTLHSLIEDQPEVGCTLHYIDSPAIDAGPIVGTARVDVDPTRSLFWHVLQLYPKGCKMIGEAIKTLAAGQELAGVQQAGEPSYYGLPEQEHFDALRSQGFDVWQRQDVVSLYRRYLSDET